jgi:hypothetical protein
MPTNHGRAERRVNRRLLLLSGGAAANKAACRMIRALASGMGSRARLTRRSGLRTRPRRPTALRSSTLWRAARANGAANSQSMTSTSAG